MQIEMIWKIVQSVIMEVGEGVMALMKSWNALKVEEIGVLKD